jgi:hypothetical protein
MALKVRFPAKKLSAHENDRIIIRLPDGLHEKLETAARETHRTMTAVVVGFLEAGLAKYTPGLEPQEASKRLNAEAIATLNEIIGKAKDVLSVLSAQQLTTKDE